MAGPHGSKRPARAGLTQGTPANLRTSCAPSARVEEKGQTSPRAGYSRGASSKPREFREVQSKVCGSSRQNPLGFAFNEAIENVLCEDASVVDS